MSIKNTGLHYISSNSFTRAAQDITSYYYFTQNSNDCEVYIRKTPFGHRRLEILTYPNLECGKITGCARKFAFKIKLLKLKFLNLTPLATRDKTGKKQSELNNRRIDQIKWIVGIQGEDGRLSYNDKEHLEVEEGVQLLAYAMLGRLNHSAPEAISKPCLNAYYQESRRAEEASRNEKKRNSVEKEKLA